MQPANSASASKSTEGPALAPADRLASSPSRSAPQADATDMSESAPTSVAAFHRLAITESPRIVDGIEHAIHERALNRACEAPEKTDDFPSYRRAPRLMERGRLTGRSLVDGACVGKATSVPAGAELWVPDDLPEVSVWVAEIPGVDA